MLEYRIPLHADDAVDSLDDHLNRRRIQPLRGCSQSRTKGDGGEGGNYTQNANYTQWIKNFVKVTKIFGTPFPAFLPEVFINITLID